MINKFKTELKQVISTLKEELQNREQGIDGEGTVEQLEETYAELAQITDIINAFEVIEKYPRHLYCVESAKHEWNWNQKNPSELLIKLIYLDEMYRKLWENTAIEETAVDLSVENKEEIKILLFDKDKYKEDRF